MRVWMLAERSLTAVALACLAAALLACGAGPAAADDLILAEQGRTAYQIVLPDYADDDPVAPWIRQAAALMQRVFETNGAALPVVVESAVDPDRPGLYLGATRFAKRHGIAVEHLPGWTYVHRAVGRDLVLAGQARPDLPNPLKPARLGQWTQFQLGTAKAVVDFLKTYGGVRFLYPGEAGREYLPTPVIAVPADLAVRKDPAMDYMRVHAAEWFYALANNYLPPLRVVPYAHTYPYAVPADRWFESHPEYFILVNGKRVAAGNHLCISNPDVREMIYRMLADHFERGMEAVTLSQTDAFTPCQCTNCFALYQTGDDWKEKLWQFHRDLAERLYQKYPDGTVMIMSYAPVIEPPRSFTNFPPNVRLQTTRYAEEVLRRWHDFGVPRGLCAYVYNWGGYHITGYTPQRTPRSVEIQAKAFRRYNVRSVFVDGFGNTYGLEAPVYYIYGRMFDDPDGLNGDLLLEEFLAAAYQEAAAPMRQFYSLLYRRLEVNASLVGYRSAHDGYPDLRTGREIRTVTGPEAFLSYLYPPAFVKSLDRELKRAETLARHDKVIRRLALARREFEFLRRSMEIIYLYNAFQVRPSHALFTAILDALDERNAFMDTLLEPIAGGVYRARPVEGWPDITSLNVQPDILRVNGRLRGGFGAPFTWDTAVLRQTGLPGLARAVVSRTAAPVTLGAAAWTNAPTLPLKGYRGTALQASAHAQLLYDDQALYVRFVAERTPGDPPPQSRGHDHEATLFQQDALHVSLDPFGDRSRAYHFLFHPASNSSFEAANGFIEDATHPRYGRDDPTWDGAWKYETTVTTNPPRWRALVTIPFRTLGVDPPAAGAVWTGNFGRGRPLPDRRGTSEYSLWAGALFAGNIIFDKESFGDIVFE